MTVRVVGNGLLMRIRFCIKYCGLVAVWLCEVANYFVHHNLKLIIGADCRDFNRRRRSLALRVIVEVTDPSVGLVAYTFITHLPRLDRDSEANFGVYL